jgi:hypothetical protein
VSQPILILLYTYPKDNLVRNCGPGLQPLPGKGDPAVILCCDRPGQAFSGEVVILNLASHTYTVKITDPLTVYHPNCIHQAAMLRQDTP